MRPTLTKRAGRPASGARRAASLSRCPRCRAVARSDAPRCALCGNRLVSAPAGKAALSAGPSTLPPREARAVALELTPIQREILQAAQYGKIGDHTIYVMGSGIAGEGEVKSGGRRFYGNAALEALAALTAPGLIQPAGEDRFELTEAGTRSAVRFEMSLRFGSVSSFAGRSRREAGPATD